jgi:hypothetical protein
MEENGAFFTFEKLYGDTLSNRQDEPPQGKPGKAASENSTGVL